ncbi:MAG: hypothetical protein LJE70_21170, partial [Chromatiaceae bacterium]|nr:hypothetical protein [Chromatiaceae bacterium]
ATCKGGYPTERAPKEAALIGQSSRVRAALQLTDFPDNSAYLSAIRLWPLCNPDPFATKEQISVDQVLYENAEDSARARKAGLRQDPNPIPPWEWWKNNRAQLMEKAVLMLALVITLSACTTNRPAKDSEEGTSGPTIYGQISVLA